MKTLEKISKKQLEQFRTIRKKIQKMVLFSILITLGCAAIISLQLLYPFHVVIGLGIYFLSFIPLIYRIYVSRRRWKKNKTYKQARNFFKRERRIITFVILFTLFAMSFFVLRPLGSNMFNNISDDEIRQIVKDDMYKSIAAMDYMETSGNELLESLDVEEGDRNNTEDIERKFDDFLTAVMFSESITDVHRYFGNIPYRLHKERRASFLMSYSLYVKKYEIVRRVMSSVSGKEYQKKILNEHTSLYERGEIYNEMVNMFYAPKTRLRITGGKLYMTVFGRMSESEYNGSFELLRVKAKESYKYLFNNFDKTLIDSGELVADNTRSRMFDLWFPIQKGVANTMGHTIISSRGKDYFVSRDQIEVMENVMLPGDIMLQRRNWHLSNVGIPGFWTHSAIYTGDIGKMDKYFAPLFPFGGQVSFSLYIKDKFPDVYDQYQKLDEAGDDYSVIEGIEPGIVLTSIEHSAHADFVGTLRPKLSKKDKMLALFKSFEHFGKPYDYNFDFDTRDALVCSELVFDAYFDRPPEQKGISFDTTVVNGRKIVSPLTIAEKYKGEYNNGYEELEFVYFIEGNEEKQSAFVSTKSRFLQSVTWNKFSFNQE